MSASVGFWPFCHFCRRRCGREGRGGGEGGRGRTRRSRRSRLLSFLEEGGLAKLFFHSKGCFAKFVRFGARIWVILANMGVILGPILEPGGRMGPVLDPLKKQTPRKSKMPSVSRSSWGPFQDHFGVICGALSASFFGPCFWRPFGTHLGPFWGRFEAKRGLKNSQKR